MSLNEATDMRKWNRVLRDTGQEAELALLRGDVEGAFKAKNQQLKTHLLAREAKQFSEEVFKGIRPLLSDEQPPVVKEAKIPDPMEPPKEPRASTDNEIIRRYEKKAFPKQVNSDYAAHIKQLLFKAGIPIEIEQPVLDEALNRAGKDLTDFVKEKNANGAYIQLSSDLKDPAWASVPGADSQIKTMNVRQYREFFDSLRSLDHNGRMEKLIQLHNEFIAKEEYAQRVVDTISQGLLRQRDVGIIPAERDVTRGIKHALYKFDSMMVAPEYMIDDLDMRDPMGPLNQGLFRHLQDAQHRKDAMTLDAGHKWIKFQEPADPRKTVDRPFLNPMSRDPVQNPPGVPYKIRKADVIHIAAGIGNERSLPHVVSTLVGREAYAADAVGATQLVRDWVEKNMTPQDWKLVEQMWQFFNEFHRDHTEPLSIRRNGVIPDPVKLTPWNGHSGGMYPIIRDYSIANKTDNKVFNSNYQIASTSKAYTKPPEDLVPVKITNADLHLGYAIRQMIHDTAMGEAIDNARKILGDDRIRGAIDKYYGHEYRSQLDYWLKDIANSSTNDEKKLETLNSWARGLRHTIAVQALGLNMKVLLTPNIGPLLNYMVRDSFRPNKTNFWYNFAVSGMLNLATFRQFSSLDKGWKFAMDNSPDLRNRTLNINRDLHDAMLDLAGRRGLVPKIQRGAVAASLIAAAKIDQFLGFMLWTQEYNNVFLKGKGYFGDTRALHDHDAAVYSANKLFRKWFGTFSPVNLPAVMRQGDLAKTMTTMFYSYGSTMYNTQRDVIRLGTQFFGRTRKGLPAGRWGAFTAMMGMSMAFIIIPSILGYMYNPDIIQDDDSWPTLVGKLLLNQFASTIPIMRDVASGYLGGSFRTTSPQVQVLDQIGRGLKAADQYIETGEPSQHWIKDTMTAAGILTGLPLTNPGRAGQFIWDTTTGADEAETYMDWINGLMYGTTRSKKAAGHLLDPEINAQREFLPWQESNP